MKNQFLEILTWIGEFRPGNKTIYTVVDEESDFQVKNKQCLRPEGKNREKHNFKKYLFEFDIFLFLYFLNTFMGLVMVFQCFCHNSELSRAFLTKNGGRFSFQPPGPASNLQDHPKPPEVYTLLAK